MLSLPTMSSTDWNDRARTYVDLSADELDELRDEHSYHPKGNPDGVRLECPDCSSGESVVCPEDDIGVCTDHECGAVHAVGECLGGHQRMVLNDGGSEGTLCSQCEKNFGPD